MGTRVYITNFAGHDYAAAEKYGELIWITKGYVSFQSLDRVKFEVVEKIQGSTPDDWLLLSGTLLISVVAALAWLSKHGVVKLLIFDKKDSSFRELIITHVNLHAIEEAISGS